MGNKESIQEEHARSCSNSDERVFTMDNTDRGRMHSTDQTVAVVKLFEKLQLTQDGGCAHPGELAKTTFENAFQGPLHLFGKLLYRHMVTVSSATDQDKITQEQFVSASREILNMDDGRQIVRYYFHFFAEGKDFMAIDDAKRMFEVSFALTLSLSKILYEEDERDPAMFGAMAAGLFGVKTSIGLDEFSKWLNQSCPQLFHPIHSWITQVLTGSSLPQEMEVARVPQLEGVVSSSNCSSMAVLWLLSVILPPVYTRPPASSPLNSEALSPSGNSATKDPLWTSLLLFRKMARLPQVQGWKLLYNSHDHGLSINRFSSHVSAYRAPTVTFIVFEGENLYALAIDQSWSIGPKKFGGADCVLIQLLPVFRVVQAGEKMVRWNETLRDVPKGISIGCDGKPEVLRLTQDFDRILHHGAPCNVHKIEVWGCGADSALQAQKSQKDWEMKAVQKENLRKLRPEVSGEDWRNSPDKQILQWGGVNVGNHSYSQ